MLKDIEWIGLLIGGQPAFTYLMNQRAGICLLQTSPADSVNGKLPADFEFGYGFFSAHFLLCSITAQLTVLDAGLYLVPCASRRTPCSHRGIFVSAPRDTTLFPSQERHTEIP
jgi:hypothetical protein